MKLLLISLFSVTLFCPVIYAKGTTIYECIYNQSTSKNGLERANYSLNFSFKDGKANTFSKYGKAQVLVVNHHEGITFIEVTQNGSVMSTTIQNSTLETVSSRNTLLNGVLRPEQFFGTCTKS